MNSIDIQTISKIFEETCKSDPSKALEGFREYYYDESFFPWGAHYLMTILQSQGNDAAPCARQVAFDIAKKCSSFAPSWWPQLCLLRGTKFYESRCAEIIAHFVSGDVAPADNNLVPFLAGLLSSRSALSNVLLARFVERDLLSLADASAIAQCIDFFVSAEELLQTYARADGPVNWSFGLLDSNQVCIKSEDCFILNLSALKIRTMVGWGLQLADAFAVTSSSLFNWGPFRNDRGINSWPSAKEDNRLGAVFLRLAANPLSWLDLKPAFFEGQPSLDHKSAVQVSLPRIHIETQEKQLLVRAGNVELLALWTALNNPGEARIAAEAVAMMAQNALGSKEKFGWEPYPRPWTDPIKNIIRLQTNAGWYAFPGSAESAFVDWSQRYRDALCTGNLLSMHDEEMLAIATLCPSFRTQKPHGWDEAGFLRRLSGSRVTFVTAFSEEIEENYRLGGLEKLWNDIGLGCQPTSLNTVSAPMSVWPFYPQASWSETFLTLRDKTFEAIDENDSDLFLASCGSYGLPIVAEVFEYFHITSIYYGHQTNLYFGMFTEDSKNKSFYLEHASSSHWIKPRLQDKFPEIRRIDGGRYT